MIFKRAENKSKKVINLHINSNHLLRWTSAVDASRWFVLQQQQQSTSEH
jgi:hypothetical protein